MQELFSGLQIWQSTVYSFALIFIAMIIGLILYALLFRLLDKAARFGLPMVDTRLTDRWVSPARVILPLLMAMIVAPYLLFHPEITRLLRHIFALSFIASGTWLLINTSFGIQEVILSRYDIIAEDNLKARTVHTQIHVLVRIFIVVIVILAIALALMTFPRIRQIGFSILASAGIIGIIAGIAAQRSIANFLAGIQIAFSQPIRIDDVVIIEGEWGVIEKITLTYVVVRLWDLRRLVVPIIYFLEKPFQNWTHTGSNLLGTVLLHADYMLPVQELREELHRILSGSSFWNGKAWALHVTDAKEQTLELRAMVSADNAGNLWELRCHVREKLTEFVKLHHPGCLPRLRAEVSRHPEDEREPEDR